MTNQLTLLEYIKGSLETLDELSLRIKLTGISLPEPKLLHDSPEFRDFMEKFPTASIAYSRGGVDAPLVGDTLLDPDHPRDALEVFVVDYAPFLYSFCFSQSCRQYTSDTNLFSYKKSEPDKREEIRIDLLKELKSEEASSLFIRKPNHISHPDVIFWMSLIESLAKEKTPDPSTVKVEIKVLRIERISQHLDNLKRLLSNYFSKSLAKQVLLTSMDSLEMTRNLQAL